MYIQSLIIKKILIIKLFSIINNLIKKSNFIFIYFFNFFFFILLINYLYINIYYKYFFKIFEKL